MEPGKAHFPGFFRILEGTWGLFPGFGGSLEKNFSKNPKKSKIFLCKLGKMGYNKEE